MLTLLLGGARAGKSSLAERWASAHAADGGAVAVVATGERVDAEMAARIERHAADRPADWTVVEEPVDLARAIRSVDADAFVIVDCLTTWLGNLAARDRMGDALELLEGALAAVAARPGRTVVISNEVGLGIVPADPMSRGYRDLLGWINQRVAAAADEARFLVAGRALRLDPLEP